MFFKRLIAYVLGFTTIGTALGCGLQVGEKAPQQPAIAYNGKSYTCVGQIPQHIEKYMKDELNDEEISEFMHCLQNAFTSFAQYTRGRDESTYAADEIRNFLEKSFVRDRTISDELLHEFMVIKQAFVGGDSVRIARSELFEAVSFLEDLRVEAIRLRPHVKYLNPRLVVNQDPRDLGQRLGEANAALKQSINVVGGRLQKTKKVYPLNNLESFLTQFRTFVRWEEHFTSARPVAMWIAMLRSFKEITVSADDPDVIHEEEWVPLLQNMSGWYLTYLQYEVGIKGQPILQGVGLQNTLYLADEAFQLTRKSVERQPITFEQMSRLATAMHDLGWIPEKVRVASLDKGLRALVTRMGGDSLTKANDRHAIGLDIKALNNLESEFIRWAHVQMTLDRRFNSETRPEKTPNIQGTFALSPDVRAKINALNGDSDWDEFNKIQSLKPPFRALFVDGIDRVELVPDTPAERDHFGLRFGFYDLSLMNILRSSAALVFRGYAENTSAGSPWTSGIKSSELQQFYVDFRDLGIDLAVVDKRNTNSGSRAFVEGKLFTSSSQGLNYDSKNPDAGELGFVESMEYFAYLYSGGQAGKDIFTQLKLDCQQGPPDINGEAKISRVCALSRLPAMVDRYLGNMPYLQFFLRTTSQEKRAVFSKVILDTAFSPTASDPKWLEKNEVTTLTVVTHYVESVMIRFDGNQDGLLDNQELENAVPIFSGFIKKIAKDTQRKDLTDQEARAAFYYILKYKMIPTSTWTDKLYIYRNEWFDPNLSLDRLQLAEVFQAIIGRLFEVGKAKMMLPQSMTSTVGQTVAR